MPDSTNDERSHPLQPGHSAAATELDGVHGWLLLLCLMLTVLGPLISVVLAVHEYARFLPYFAKSNGTHAAILMSIALQFLSVAYGIFAGVQLWLIRPDAVNSAKKALLLGLAVDMVITIVSKSLDPVAPADGHFLRHVVLHVVPGLIFFTLCFAYLNKSTRVAATYRLQPD